MNKLSMIPVSRKKIYDLRIEERRIDYQIKAKIVAFKFLKFRFPKSDRKSGQKSQYTGDKTKNIHQSCQSQGESTSI